MNSSNEDLIYSAAACSARIEMLGADQNDINIIVEDMDKEYIYETFFSKMFDYKIGIFAAGGKPAVKALYAQSGAIDVYNPSIKYFYLMDGDFDRYIFNDDMIADSCCLYLKTYNIENYFIDENAVNKFVKGRLKCCDNELLEKFDFRSWQSNIVEQSSKLFILYCYIQFFRLDIVNTSETPYIFIDSSTGLERKDRAFENFRNRVLSYGEISESTILEIRNRYESINGDNYFNLICGKFLLTSLRCYICSVFKKNSVPSAFRDDDFEWYLINNFDISKLNYLKIAIENCISS